MTDNGRGTWGSELQFLLTSVGYAVGLGNLWRFPSIAYENGGGAFLIPYLCCSIVIGLPLLYMEFFVGQFTQNGPSVAFRNYFPALQGIGWTSTLCSFMIGIYYNVIIVYCVLYLIDILFNDVSNWTSCGNAWNTNECMLLNDTSANGTLAADEFYLHKVLKISDSINDLGTLNVPVLVVLVVIWIFTALCLVKGVKYIGKMAYVTATMPYLIIGFFFIMVLQLDGASSGLKYFLFQPKFEKLLEFNTWIAAANQLCFSLSIGFGGLLSLSSFNARKHNCFKDALVIVFCDGFMSIFGGCVIFAILGFLSHEVGRPIDHLIQSQGGIAFVAYPEAFARMGYSSALNFLLFFMFFLLGISSQFGTMQPMLTSMIDQFPVLRKQTEAVAISACFISFIVGLSMCWGNGNYWLNLYNNWMGANTVFIACFLEIMIIIHIYGIHNFRSDIEECLGGSEGRFQKIFGKSGVYFTLCWTILAPVLIFVLIVTTFINQAQAPVDGPYWTRVVGYILEYCPLIFIPIFAFINIRDAAKSEQGWKSAFRIQPSLFSFKKVNKTLDKIYPEDHPTIIAQVSAP
ncbi:unnamed protein product [Auanema sp. JU1783]|nr:unnamed protein product [Auanema sp. JU1783]